MPENLYRLIQQICMYKGMNDDRGLLIASVRKWGDITTDAVLDPVCKLFQTPHIDGVIGYRLASGYAVVYGDPICAQENKGELAQAFHQYCLKQGYTDFYLMVSEEFARWALKHFCHILLEYGDKVILNPQNNPLENSGTKGSLVRRKVKQAVREGVVFQEYTTAEASIEQGIEHVANAWLKKREGPQIHISHVYPFADRPGKRWFYVTRKGLIIGVIILNQIQGGKRWLMNHLMVSPDAPHGTSELLVVNTLEALKKEGCSYVTCGASPAKNLGEVCGLGRTSEWCIRNMYSLLYRFFHLEGLMTFWAKFQPEGERTYLLFSEKKIHLGTIKAILKGLNVTIVRH